MSSRLPTLERILPRLQTRQRAGAQIQRRVRLKLYIVTARTSGPSNTDRETTRRRTPVHRTQLPRLPRRPREVVAHARLRRAATCAGGIPAWSHRDIRARHRASGARKIILLVALMALMAPTRLFVTHAHAQRSLSHVLLTRPRDRYHWRGTGRDRWLHRGLARRS